jgi:hypothetical protein
MGLESTINGYKTVGVPGTLLEDTIAEVLLQKNDDGREQPIAFMSKALQNSELNYTIMEKQSYALVKFLKHFWVYVGYSKVVGYVPHPAVKDILAQQDCLGVRGKWVSKIQEYDLEIKPTKLIKGQGLAQMSKLTPRRSRQARN